MKSCPTCQGSYPNNFAVCPQDGTGLVEVGAWSDGALIRGKYRILAKVGQGGMGAVYKALHLAFDELRALKVISMELMSDELFVKRFKHEAVITRRLQHPNAVRVDDIDEAEDGRPYIVMEYIEGRSLKKLILDEGPLPVPRVCSIIKQAALALDAAHRLGMVHRDIKPDNIVLVESPQGEQAKVLDFGIAKIKEARLGGEGSGMTLTGTGVVIGTPQYMSPEQAMGKRGDELDGRSDLYSLGIVMYQMLTGDLPFKADTTMGMLLAHMQTPPTPIGALRPELQIPAAIAGVVMRTLEKRPELRPASAKDLIEEIDRAEKDSAPVGATRVVRPTTVAPSAPVVGAQPAAGLAGAAGPVAPPAVARAQARPAVAAKPPAQAYPPQPGPPLSAAPPRKTAWGLWVTVIILVLGLGGGGAWYFTSHRATVPLKPVVEDTAAKVADYLSKGDQRLKLKEYEPAIQEYHEGLDLDPSNTILRARLVEAHEARGNELLKMGEYDKAIGEYEHGLTHDPTNAILTSSLGEAQKAKTASLSTTPEVVPKAPETQVDVKQVDAAIQRGDLYFRRGKYDEAIREYESGQKLDPSNATIATKLADAQNAKSAQSATLRSTRVVAQQRPQSSVDPAKVSAAIKMGDFYFNRGEYDTAIGEYEKGLTLDPGNAALRSRLDRVKKAKAAESRVLH